MRYYTGVGSRETPEDVLEIMERAAAWLAGRGWWLRSGHALGADRAFERGAGGKATIYLPWPGFGTRKYKGDPGCAVLGESVVDEQLWLANYARLRSLELHDSDTRAVQLLHGRNVAQVEGHTREQPFSKLLVCWCPVVDGREQGGTATAVKLARWHKIPVLNLSTPEDRARVEQRLG